MREDLALGIIVAVTGAGGTVVALGIVSLFIAALRRALPPGK